MSKNLKFQGTKRFSSNLFAMSIFTISCGTVYSQGFNFTSASVLNDYATSDSVDEFEPRLVTDGTGNWIAYWRSEENIGGTTGTDFDIVYATSDDNGANWSAAATLNSNATSDTESDSGPDIVTDGNGIWVAVWQSGDDLSSTIGNDVDILFARSTNNGSSWSTAAPLNSNADTDSGNDTSPRLATDGNGNYIAVWSSTDTLSSTIGADSDILFSTSDNHGVTWSAPEALASNAASDSGIDSDVKIQTDDSGNWIVVWESDDTLTSTIGSDDDLLFSLSTNNGGDWSTEAILNTNAASDSGNDSEPTFATDKSGNWIVVWTSSDSLVSTIGTDFDILFTRSTNNGTSWSSPAALNSNFAGTLGDIQPHIAYGGGEFFVTWSSFDSLSSTIGIDLDIFGSRSTDGGATWETLDYVNDYAASDTSVDSHPASAASNGGFWMTIWRSEVDLGSIGTDDDILFATSTSLPVELDQFIVE